jgi:alkylated DNA repair dioxygenase AlkB
MHQISLLDSALPQGMYYAPDFITAQEERTLLAEIHSLPLSEARYRQYTARRRTFSYGAGYDFSLQRTTPAPDLPPFLAPFVARAAAWAKIPAAEFVQALISEYQPGTPLGWHRDVPAYELIVGISLAGEGRMRFRPYPWEPQLKKQVFALQVAPRSAYILSGDSRWRWQHSVPPAKELRYSLTLRTRNRELHAGAER